MRHKLLAVWYILVVVLIVEIAAYGITGFMANSYRKIMWDRFNAGVREWHEADSTLPYAGFINYYSKAAGISGQAVAGVIQAESSFQPRARSSSGAYGLMQIIPSTWRQVNNELKVCAVRHPGECTSECYYDPELNIRIGTAYLSQLYKSFNGDMVLALAAYNAGPGEVSRYGTVPPFKETNDYIDRIITYWYKVQNQPVPAYGLNAAYWKSVQNTLGWWVVFTAALIIFTMWKLFKRHRSWRWR